MLIDLRDGEVLQLGGRGCGCGGVGSVAVGLGGAGADNAGGRVLKRWRASGLRVGCWRVVYGWRRGEKGSVLCLWW